MSPDLAIFLVSPIPVGEGRSGWWLVLTGGLLALVLGLATPDVSRWSVSWAASVISVTFGIDRRGLIRHFLNRSLPRKELSLVRFETSEWMRPR